MAVELAVAYVSLVPSAKGIGQKISNEIDGPIQEAGRRAGAAAGEHAGSAFSEKFKSAGAGLMKIGAGLTLGVSAPLALVGKQALDAASDLNESLSKATVVFGDYADGIIELGDRAAKELGQSRQQVIEAASTFGNLFVSLGLAKPAAAKMSSSLVQLASDIGSLNNVDSSQVLEALRSGLVGETEPMRQFGVNMNETTIKAKALQLGLVSTTVDAAKLSTAQEAVQKATRKVSEAVAKHGANSVEASDATRDLEQANNKLADVMRGKVPDALDPAVKAQAAYALIMEQTKTAQGDFARTATGVANTQKIVTAQFEDAKAKIGAGLLPIFAKVASTVSIIIDRFTNLSPRTQELILIAGGVLAALGPLVTMFGALATVVAFIASPIGLAVAALVGLAALAVLAYVKIKPFHDLVNAVGASIADFVVPHVQALAAALQDKIIPAIVSAAQAVAVYLTPKLEALRQAFEKNRPQIESIIGALQTLGVWIAEHIMPIIIAWGGLMAGWWIDRITDAVRAVGALVDAIKDIIHFAQKAWDILGKIPSLGSIGGAIGIPGFAGGGYLAPGQIGWTGEKGPELTVGGRYGTAVLTHAASMRVVESSGGGSPAVHLTVNPTPGMSEERVGRVAADRVAWELRTAPR